MQLTSDRWNTVVESIEGLQVKEYTKDSDSFNQEQYSLTVMLSGI